jgi:hypothetical protein
MNQPEPVMVYLRASRHTGLCATTLDGFWFHLPQTGPLLMRALARHALGLPAGYPVNFYLI